MAKIYIGKKRKEFDFKKLVRKHELAKESPKEASHSAWDDIHEQWDTSSNGIVPGQLCSFKYYEPKTKEDLEYYDATPLTIFFGVANTRDGKRVIGLNLHYYPRYTREKIMQKILEMYGPLFKSLSSTTRSAISNFNWTALNKQIINVGLAFGIRMYIPSLIQGIAKIPIEGWPTAFYTEGAFKKETRKAILKYWREYSASHKVKTNKKKR